MLYNKNFVLLLQGAFVSRMGDYIFNIALGFTVFRLTGSTVLMSIVLILYTAPQIALGFFAGVVADRYNKKAILVIADFICGIASTTVGVLALFSVNNIPLLLGCTLVIAISKCFFEPVATCLLPEIVGDDKMLNANMVLTSIEGIAMTIGKFAGGFLLAILGAPVLFILNGVTFFLSGISEMFLTLQHAKCNDEVALVSKRFLKKELRTTLTYIFKDPVYKNFLFTIMLSMFFTSMAASLIIPLFDVNFSAQAYSLATGFMAVSMVLGGGIFSSFSMNRHIIKIFLISVTMLNLQLFFLPFLTETWQVILLFMLCGLFIAPFNAIMESVLIITVPQEDRGKIGGMVMSIVTLLTPAGLFAGGFLGEFLAFSAVLPTATAMAIGVVLLFMLNEQNRTIFNSVHIFKNEHITTQVTTAN